MAKSKLVNADGSEVSASAPKIKGVKPVNNQVLIEMLTKNEVLNTNLYVGDGGVDAVGAPQAYILAIGPGVNKDLNLKVGDRVLLQGMFVPVPKFDDSPRLKGLVLPDMIKGILVE